MIQTRFLRLALGFFVVLISVSCGGKTTPKTAKVKIPDKGNSIYYYLLSTFEDLRGRAESADFYLNKSIKKDNRSTYLPLQKAYRLARQNKLDEAYDLAQKAIKTSPNEASLHLLLGKIETTRDNSLEAIDHYKKVCELDPKNEEALNLLARQYVTARKSDLAIATIERLMVVNPEATQARFLLASIYATEKKDLNRALATYLQLNETNPDDPRVLQLIAEIYLAQKDYKKALVTFEKLIGLVADDMNARVRVALLYYELKDLDGAIRTFETILKDYPKADKILYYLGLLHYEKGNVDQGLDYFSQVPSSSSYFVDALARRVVILVKQERASEAIAAARGVLGKNKPTAELYDILASVYIFNDNYPEALKILKEAQKNLPESESVLFSLGDLYEKMGEWKTAITYMQKVLAMNPNSAAALNFIGYTYTDNNVNLDEAQALIERALKVKPNDGYIIDSLGWVYFKKGDVAKATTLLEQANQLAPKEPTILEHLGDLAVSRGDKRGARRYYENSLFSLNKKTPKAKGEKDQIERIRKKMESL